jgi:hypothetical protein
MISNLSDKDIINYYRLEYFKEWYSAWKNGIDLTANDIRVRLGLK